MTKHPHMRVHTHTHTHTQLKQVILFECFFVFWLLLYSFFPWDIISLFPIHFHSLVYSLLASVPLKLLLVKSPNNFLVLTLMGTFEIFPFFNLNFFSIFNIAPSCEKKEVNKILSRSFQLFLISFMSSDGLDTVFLGISSLSVASGISCLNAYKLVGSYICIPNQEFSES